VVVYRRNGPHLRRGLALGIKALLGVIALASAQVSGNWHAQAEARLPDREPSWRATASSDLIAKGTLIVPIDSATSAIPRRHPYSLADGYVTLRLVVGEVFKGKIETESEGSRLERALGFEVERLKRRLPANEVWIDYYVVPDESNSVGPLRESYAWPKSPSPSPPPEQVKALNNKEVIVFLVATEEFGLLRYFFSDQQSGVLVEAKDGLNQITGEDFGGCWSERTKRARARCVSSWRVYLAYMDYFQKHGRLPD
jgi:hypothetical protein